MYTIASSDIGTACTLQDYSSSYYPSYYVVFGYSITTLVTRVVIYCGGVVFSYSITTLVTRVVIYCGGVVSFPRGLAERF